jgi:hypothetical protein
MQNDQSTPFIPGDDGINPRLKDGRIIARLNIRPISPYYDFII